MASSRAPARRNLSTPVPRPVLSLEEWESKAPLSDTATRSINTIKLASETKPLPPKFSADEGSGSRPATPTLRTKIASSSRPSTPIPARTNASLHALHPRQPIQTPQQFYDWFTLIDRSVAHSQESHFHAHLETVSGHLETCDSVLERIDLLDREVSDMLEGWRSVEDGGKSLKEACERLLEEKDQLLQMTDAVGMRLQYFQELEHATRMLNHPGDSLVLQTDFLYMVERVDICIDYLKAHRHFRESEVHLLRFQQCMTRAMTLIKMFFVGSLRALTSDISRRLFEKDVSATAQSHLLYTRFTSVTSQLAPLLGELERRAQAHPDELSALLTECHTAYFGSRRSLLISRLVDEIKGLDPTRTELVELTRAGCSYLKQLCTDEFELFRTFFNSGEDQLYQFLENLCDYLYDDLRPRILHEPRITVLCDVCTVLQALMVLDVPTASESDDEDDDIDEISTDLDQPAKRRKKGLGRLHISHLLQMVLQDAQTRLFFKAQSIIQAEIRYYIPKPEDLAYPDKLVAARKPLTGSGYQMTEKKENFSQMFQLKSLDKQDTWFPTLQKTIWVLSQLHDFVKPAIFEDIAQEAVNICRQSLVSASGLMKGSKVASNGASANAGARKLDGGLFLVRHLLILKEMTQNLDFVNRDTTNRTVDLSAVTDTLASMLGRTTALLPNSLFASLGMPRGNENMSDVRHGIDHELKKACEDVISDCAESVYKTIRDWNTSQSSKSQPPPASVVEELDQNFRLSCHRDLRSAVSRMRLYLEDDRTVNVLLSHVQDKIVDEYVDFRQNVADRSGNAALLSVPGLKEMLAEICEEEVGEHS